MEGFEDAVRVLPERFATAGWVPITGSWVGQVGCASPVHRCAPTAVTGPALGLVLVAAVAHATWNLAAKRAGVGGPPFVWLVAGVEVGLFTPVAVIALVTGATTDLRGAGAALFSGILHSAYFLLLQRSYKTGDLSVVYPVARGLGPLLAVCGALLLLGERPPVLAYIGAAAVSAGVLWLASLGSGPRTGTALSTPGLAYAVLTGMAIATYTVWDGYAIRVLSVPPLLFFWGTSVGRLAVLSAIVPRYRTNLRPMWQRYRRQILIVGVLSPLSYVLVLFAFTMAPVSFIAPAREVSIVIATLFGTQLLREGRRSPRLAAASCIVGGVFLLGIA